MKAHWSGRSSHSVFTAIAGALICSLGKDAPQGGQIQTPDEGKVIEIQEVGGLHHHYERRIALPHHNLSGGYLTAVDAAATRPTAGFSSTAESISSGATLRR